MATIDDPTKLSGLAAPATDSGSVAGAIQTMSANVFGSPSGAAAPPMDDGKVVETSGFVPKDPTVAAPPPPPPPPSGYTPPPANLDDSSASRLQGMITSGSPLMRIAEQNGLNLANRRGLLNSSIAVGAAQRAQIEAAQPFALTDAQIAAQKNLSREDQAAQMARLQEQGRINSGLAEQQFGFQRILQGQENEAQMNRLLTQLSTSERMQDRDLAASLQRLREQNQSEMTRLQEQLKSADAQQQRDIQAQMERLNTSMAGEMQRLVAAAGFDMSRLQAQGQIDIARDAANARNAQDLARVQGQIQSALQAQGNTEQIQRMGVELANNLALQSQDQNNALARIAATGDQEIRRLVEAANQERVTLQQSIAAQDRERMANAMVSIFQIEGQMRAALLSNTNIPAAERSGYERAISSLGNPIREYIDQLFGTAAAPAEAPATPTAPSVGLMPGTGGEPTLPGGNIAAAPLTTPTTTAPTTGSDGLIAGLTPEQYQQLFAGYRTMPQ